MKMERANTDSSVEDEDVLYVLVEIMENTGYWLQKDPRTHARKLKLMQKRISELTRFSSERRLVFLDHFLTNYVDRMWNNLAVDFTYESGNPGKNILDGLLRNVGKTLVDISNSLREGDIKKCEKALHDFASAYAGALREVSEKKEEIRKVKVISGKIEKPEAIKPEKLELYRVLQESGAITQSEYTLAGGAPSRHFFDIDKLLSKARYVDVISEYYAKEINALKNENKIDKLAFIEKDIGTIGVLPLMSSILIKTKMEAFIVRLSKEAIIGKIKCSYGAEPKKSERIGIVSDVATTSKGILDAAEAIRESGAKPLYAFVLYNREQGAERILEREGIDLKAILNRSELERIGFISPAKEHDFEPKEANVIPPPDPKIKRYAKGLGSKTLKWEEQIEVWTKS